MEEVLSVLKTVFNHDHLYTRGGNSSFVTFDLNDNISLISNEDGIKGGAVLWKRPSFIEISKDTFFKKSPTEVIVNNDF